MITVLGLGYVGFPVLEALHQAGETVLGFDTSEDQIRRVQSRLSGKRITGIGLTSNPADMKSSGTFIVCVPTPLSPHGLPDTSFVAQAAEMIRLSLYDGEQTPLVVLESSVAPGTTRELFLEHFEESGLRLDYDFLLGYSPERIDPGNRIWELSNTPKIVAGASPRSLEAVKNLYQLICHEVIEAENLEAAETAKLFENTYRLVNISLVNELAMALHGSGTSVTHVLDLASTKPFGFMQFKPGPGAGGHCIPVDPLYLNNSIEARHGRRLAMVDQALEINRAQPLFHANNVRALLRHVKVDQPNSIRVLVAGVAYKENSEDVRETPAEEVIRKLRGFGYAVLYFDPNVPTFKVDELSVPKYVGGDEKFDLVVLLHKFDHDLIEQLSSSAELVYDTRG